MMVKTVEGLFDGSVIRPDEPLPLEPNTRVRITVEVPPPPASQSRSFLRTARALQLDGPPDWAENLDAHLYGDQATDAG